MKQKRKEKQVRIDINKELDKIFSANYKLLKELADN